MYKLEKRFSLLRLCITCYCDNSNQIKAAEQYVPVVLWIMLYKVIRNGNRTEPAIN